MVNAGTCWVALVYYLITHYLSSVLHAHLEHLVSLGMEKKRLFLIPQSKIIVQKNLALLEIL